MSNQEKQRPEQRIFGALPLITRKSEAEVLLIRDEPKVEMSAGIQPLMWWEKRRTAAWGLPGGGRQTHPSGVPETLKETLLREVAEEISPDFRSFPNMLTNIKYGVYPFVAAQLPGDGTIRQFGVTSVQFAMNDLRSREQRAIQTTIDEGQAQWVSMDILHRIANDIAADTQIHEGIGIRPQVLSAAVLWTLSLTSTVQAREWVIDQNREIISKVEHDAHHYQMTIKNGSMQRSGEVKEDLNQRDRYFLFPRTRKRI